MYHPAELGRVDIHWALREPLQRCVQRCAGEAVQGFYLGEKKRQLFARTLLRDQCLMQNRTLIGGSRGQPVW
ncbi:hypothetical protein [Pseudomonas sp. EZ-C24]|uniref:hypothetical protein n=1 Tax=Pseudomonas sp. EZ-C24 TaxID=2753617 RepID=UPI00165E7133